MPRKISLLIYYKLEALTIVLDYEKYQVFHYENTEVFQTNGLCI